LSGRQGKRVLLLGCGSLGSAVAELLARSGVGELHLLDKETFEAENCGRHILGARDLGRLKAYALVERLREIVPDITLKPHHALAADWIHYVCKPGNYDLIVDCTGESSVRVMLSHHRDFSLGACPVVHAWVEPFCAATHVVHLPHGSVWPPDDPGNKLAAATWPDDVQVNLPACGTGFHPYGAADVWQSAGFTTERLLSVLDNKAPEAIVWSSVRSQAFFKALGINVTTGPIVPTTGTEYDSIQITRLFKAIFPHG
jgi:molybdopterin/thiamine biosynthesis adenylyltransferase